MLNRKKKSSRKRGKTAKDFDVIASEFELPNGGMITVAVNRGKIELDGYEFAYSLGYEDVPAAVHSCKSMHELAGEFSGDSVMGMYDFHFISLADAVRLAKNAPDEDVGALHGAWLLLGVVQDVVEDCYKMGIEVDCTELLKEDCAL